MSIQKELSEFLDAVKWSVSKFSEVSGLGYSLCYNALKGIKPVSEAAEYAIRQKMVEIARDMREKLTSKHLGDRK